MLSGGKKKIFMFLFSLLSPSSPWAREPLSQLLCVTCTEAKLWMWSQWCLGVCTLAYHLCGCWVVLTTPQHSDICIKENSFFQDISSIYFFWLSHSQSWLCRNEHVDTCHWSVWLRDLPGNLAHALTWILEEHGSDRSTVFQDAEGAC